MEYSTATVPSSTLSLPLLTAKNKTILSLVRIYPNHSTGILVPLLPVTAEAVQGLSHITEDNVLLSLPYSGFGLPFLLLSEV